MGYSDTESSDHEQGITFLTPSAFYPLSDHHKDRIQPPTRTLPTRRTKAEEAPDKLTRQLFDAIANGITSYNNKEKRPGIDNGYLTLFRHGHYGVKKADKLEKSLSQKSYGEMLHLLDDFFNSKDTHYNNHSLTSYLLDKLSNFAKTLDSSFQPDTGSMTWSSILTHLKQYEKDQTDECLSVEIKSTL
ncbi:hypothetical protein DIZ81_10105 [Legionella taurinensis]|uniref:Uncharacterized protein n=1 Tax=Legionella taurinensis TaxID=70611 RepID=A0A3A5LGG2_9GAMM|nr:hypothetical protein [Legionella taurinensis]MDX1838319.1 hypothetical protein [Legionella taurinensis]PUT39193.1 hypothetical protein DB744_10115 [Legionella taurinensis]PUT39538.1 hypothetical protein DB746_13670 [Legionella taurinensis]PUT43959.1 hypothetical protein DB743_08835 [Legionella taurinensis]PUT45041.1 hypothetical protein DB745_13610 [Legionella taurinensis]